MSMGYNSFRDARIEWAYSVALKKQEEQKWDWGVAAMRAAKAKDPKMMIALERCAEAMHRMSEHQNGDTRRSADQDNLGASTEFTETQMFREAFRMADEEKHDTMEPFLWIYGAVGLLCGLSNK